MQHLYRTNEEDGWKVRVAINKRLVCLHYKAEELLHAALSGALQLKDKTLSSDNWDSWIH